MNGTDYVALSKGLCFTLFGQGSAELAVALEVLDDERFAIAPGGATRHHAYKGGLARHTFEVLCNALGMVNNAEGKRIVAMAAVFHDVGKILEYTVNDDGSIAKEPFAKMIGHVAHGYATFQFVAAKYELPEQFVFDVCHCILSHHGRREWGSPVEPKTQEAFALHSADMLSIQAQGGEDKK